MPSRRKFTIRKQFLAVEQQKRLMAIADKCPVHRTRTGQLSINTRQISE